jgi:hypothetical protein
MYVLNLLHTEFLKHQYVGYKNKKCFESVQYSTVLQLTNFPAHVPV